MNSMNVFISNKYTAWYMSIVSNPTNEGYVENHHIVPRSMGGEETVSLSARQHFICHWLLTKMVKKPIDQARMDNAFAMMCFKDRYGYRYINSYAYGMCREKIAPEIGRRVGLWNKGKPKSNEWKKNASAAMKGKHKGKKFCNKDGVTRRVPLEEYNQLLKEGWAPGRCLSSDARQKMRECALNSVLISRQRKA
jgi:hypothetical protein